MSRFDVHACWTSGCVSPILPSVHRQRQFLFHVPIDQRLPILTNQVILIFWQKIRRRWKEPMVFLAPWCHFWKQSLYPTGHTEPVVFIMFVSTGWWTFCRLTSFFGSVGNSMKELSLGMSWQSCAQDRLCIAQHDMALKEQGIRGLGCFLSKSRNLTILWSGRYFSRLLLINLLSKFWMWVELVCVLSSCMWVTFPVFFNAKSCRGYQYIKCKQPDLVFSKLRPRWCLYELASYLKDENVRDQQRNIQILPVHLCFWPEGWERRAGR